MSSLYFVGTTTTTTTPTPTTTTTTPTTTTTTPTTTTTTPTTTTTTSAGCYDKLDCASYGYDTCTSYAGWSKTNCPAYCGLCEKVQPGIILSIYTKFKNCQVLAFRQLLGKR